MLGGPGGGRSETSAPRQEEGGKRRRGLGLNGPVVMRVPVLVVCSGGHGVLRTPVGAGGLVVGEAEGSVWSAQKESRLGNRYSRVYTPASYKLRDRE